MCVCVCVCERERERERERESKEKKERFFFSCETYTRIIVIDLLIMKLFGIYLVVFSLQGKGFSM